MTRRLLKWAGLLLLVLLAIPVLAVIVVAVGTNIDLGRRFIESQTASLTGGMVHLQGLDGRFPDALRLGRIQISDTKGPYLTISGLSLDWSPLQLLHRTAQIDQLRADRVDFTRLPQSDGPKSTSNSAFNLPVRVDLRHLRIDQANIGAPVAGASATLALDGSADLPSLAEGTIHLDAQRLDSPGQYTVAGTATPTTIQASVKANEPAKGLISTIAHLPDLGPIALQASVNGPKDALATQLDLTAGELTASTSGSVDLDHQAADLAVHAQAPAMSPAPGIAWDSVLLDVKLHGPFSKPDANGAVKIAGLTAAGARIGALNAAMDGNAGQVHLDATIRDLHIPGPKPDLFAGDPVKITVSAQLDAPDRPVRFALNHTLVTLDGTAKTTQTQATQIQQVQAHLVLPQLAPLAAAAATDLSGSSDLVITASIQDGTTSAAAKGRVSITGGMAPVHALIGEDGQLDLAASLHGQDITLTRLAIDGKALNVTAQGGLADQILNLDWTVALADLTPIQPSLSGKLDAKGHTGGKLTDLAVQARIGADLSAKGFTPGHIDAKIDATGLPNAPHAVVNANGTLLDAPLTLALTAAKSNEDLQLDITQAEWKSLQAGGNLRLTPPAVIPVGNLHLDLGRLADLEPFLGRPLTGQLNAKLNADETAAKLLLTVKDASLPATAAVHKAVLTATVTDPAGHPGIDGTFTAEGVSAAAAKSLSARVTAKGPIEALVLAITAESPDIGGGPAKLSGAGTLNAQDRTLALARMETTWKQQVLKLLAPANFTFTDGVAMDRLRLGFRQAELAVSGSAGSKLDLTASLRNLPADVGAIINPAFAANGMIGADVRLTGTSAHPEGTIKLTATGIQARQGPAQSLPAANLVSTTTLLGTAARTDTKLTAGPSHASVTGTVPLSQTGKMDLKTEGRIGLAMLDPLLMAQGRRARGDITLDAAVTGTTSAPLVRGSAELRNGDVVDYAMGAHIQDLAASLQAAGDSIRLASFTGKAGPGTLGGNGTISLAGTMPVDLRFTASNARPVASDLLTALIDANLTVQGDVKGDLQAGGTVLIRRADIRIPDKLPASIAVLPVRNANTPPPPPPAPEPVSTIALNLTINAPQQVFIRGRGIDAELGGTIHIGGTAANPNPDGGLQLRRGTLSAVGTTLTFKEGKVDFSGAGLADPTVHFVANSTTSTIIATLTVSGSAKDPKITLSSVPDLPQDEILAQLLFNTSTSKLSPLQLAQIATALASLSGAAPGFDPLEKLRGTFGLDRLSVGSNSAGNPTVEAGRYVARGVYVGARQSTSGGGTQATVQVDIAKGLKLETTAGSGSSSATGSTSSADAASVGLTYQFQY